LASRVLWGFVLFLFLFVLFGLEFFVVRCLLLWGDRVMVCRTGGYNTWGFGLLRGFLVGVCFCVCLSRGWWLGVWWCWMGCGGGGGGVIGVEFVAGLRGLQHGALGGEALCVVAR